MTTMLPPTLHKLFLSDIPSLVELPSTIQNFHKLNCLEIRECINLKTLSTGINFQYLNLLDFTGCSSLKTFPNISTNIPKLYLARTGIEEVPLWIENFTYLRELTMENCNNLVRVSLNIFKLRELVKVNFSDCGALTEASWIDSPSEVAMATDDIHPNLPVPHDASSSRLDNLFPEVNIDFICLNLDPEALPPQRSIIFKKMVLSGEEVPSYFTHRTTGVSSLTIPLLHSSLLQPFFRFRTCAAVFFDSLPRYGGNLVYISVNCRFKGRHGESFDYCSQQQKFWTEKKDGHLFILDYCIPLHKESAPLAQLNYDHVDIQLHDGVYDSHEDCLSPMNQLGNPNTLPGVCETNEDNMVNQVSNQECQDRCGGTEKNRKRVRIT